MRNKTKCIYMLALAMLLAGCSARAQVYDPSSGAVVTAWNYRMQQPTAGKKIDQVLLEYLELPWPDDPAEAAQIWALAVKHCNGYAQYALLNEDLRAEKRVRYDAAGWQSGVSSPWIESFDIYNQRGGYRVDFLLNSSTGVFGRFSVKIKIDCPQGKCYITAIEHIDGDSAPYVY